MKILYLLLWLGCISPALKASEDTSLNPQRDILLVFYMHERYVTAEHRIMLASVQNLINSAMHHKHLIIFLEQVGYGPTLKSLQQQTQSYPDAYRVILNEECYEEHLLKLIPRTGVNGKSALHLCGMRPDFTSSWWLLPRLSRHLQPRRLYFYANAIVAKNEDKQPTFLDRARTYQEEWGEKSVIRVLD